ncbi:MAG: translation initiation factor IF-3, partial [Thermoguttaceae bacterium]
MTLRRMDNNGPHGGNSGNFAGQQRVNEQIRIAQVRVIADDGEQLGVMSSQDALAKARAAGLDLVEVAPQAKPPVCRIMDYGKYKYQQKKRVAKQQTNKTQIKELRL